MSTEPETHARCRIVVTGGPGGGKTTAADLFRRELGERVVVVPESATLLFQGGFPRSGELHARRSAQRAIYHVQRNLEDVQSALYPHRILLCDRGTVDGAAYWAGPDDLWAAVGTTLAAQLQRYDAVIHLRTPALHGGYNHQNPLRVESAEEASLVDQRLLDVWATHPRRFVVEPAPDFLVKAKRVLDILREELPTCCRHHQVPDVDTVERSEDRHV